MARRLRKPIKQLPGTCQRLPDSQELAGSNRQLHHSETLWICLGAHKTVAWHVAFHAQWPGPVAWQLRCAYKAECSHSGGFPGGQTTPSISTPKSQPKCLTLPGTSPSEAPKTIAWHVPEAHSQGAPAENGSFATAKRSGSAWEPIKVPTKIDEDRNKDNLHIASPT